MKRPDASGMHARVDCRDRSARNVLLELIPCCLEASETGENAVVAVDNLPLLGDSVTRLLKALARLADDLGARILLEDGSGLTSAFAGALSGNVHLDPASKG